jgi:hypothetical protein
MTRRREELEEKRRKDELRVKEDQERFDKQNRVTIHLKANRLLFAWYS